MAERSRDRNGRFVKENGTWFKNAAKSLGYAGVDLIKQSMPSVMETIEVNKEFTTDIVSTLRRAKQNNYKFNIKQQLSGKALENWNDIEDIVRNAKSDLKSGNFYNKRREQQALDDFGLDGFDLDGDFSFDMSDDLNDDNFDDSSDTKVVVPNVTINSNIDKNNPMVQAVQQQSRLMADNEAMNSRRSIAIAESQMKLDKQLTNVLYGGMETINSNLSILVNFNNEQVGGYIGASLKYYEENIKYMSEISDNLKKIGGFVEKASSFEATNPMDVIFNGEAFDLKAYTGLVKKQLKNTIDEDMLLGSISALLEGDGLKAFVQSPLTFIPQLVLSKMVPEFLTNTFKTFDKSFKSFIPALLNKMGSWADDASLDGLGYIKSFIGSVLGIKNTGKNSIDTSNYEKGVVPFDGITRKSIIEVIPGYLSKILSALTGKEELIFDSDQGKFVTKSNLKSEYDRRVRSAALSSYESRDEMKSRVDAYKERYNLSNDDTDDIKKYIDDALFKLSNRRKSLNPHAKDFDDDLTSLLSDTGASSKHIEIIRSIILSLSNAQQMNLAGAEHINARNSLTKYLTSLEESGNMLGLAQFNNLFGDDADYLKNNPLVKQINAYSGTSNTSRSVGSIFAPTDAYGKNNLDYLHDIYTILLEGIGVWTINPINRDRSGAFKDYKTNNDKRISRYRDNNPLGSDESGTIYDIQGSTAEQVEMIRHFVDSQGDAATDTQKGSGLSRFFKYLFGSKEDKQNVVDNFFGKTASLFKNFFNKIDEGMYKIIFGVNSIGNEEEVKKGFLSAIGSKFKIWLFGEKDSEGQSIGGIFNKFNTFLTDKFFNPIKDAFIGENGIITKFKKSKLYKDIIDGAKNTANKFLGSRGEDGKRSGGKFSEYYNSTVDFVRGTTLNDISFSEELGEYVNTRTGKIIADKGLINKYKELTGNKNFDLEANKNNRIGGILGEIKNIGSSFKNNIKDWLFGSDPEKTKSEAKGVFSDIVSYFKEGLQGFTDAIFGQSFDKDSKTIKSNIMVDEVIGKIKERAPKSLASGIVGGGVGLLAGAGGFGLLGSLFLGPMSGAVIGTAVGFLSQSEKFKNMLFGEKDDNGERIGGFISKSTQNFFKEHKGAIIGGTALGMLKGITGIGILPSFILGGPITGALFGLGASLISRSEAFQNMLFGEQKDDGTRSGGVLGKITGSVNNDDIKKKLGFAGAGAALGAISGTALSSFGILGSIAFGPLSGAIIGAGAAIALAANKWKDAIFGKFDEKTGKRTEQGIMSKMMAAVSVEVLQPAKVQVTEWKYQVQDWFAEKIADPFMDSLEPLKEELRRFKDRLLGFAETILDKLHITDVFTGIGESIKKGFTNIGKFIGNVSKKGVEAIGKFTGFVLSSPVKLISMVADKILLPKHMREGIASVRKQIIDNIKDTEFVKKLTSGVAEFKETVHGTVLEIGSFTKKKISGLFSWVLKGIRKLGSGLLSTITKPFTTLFSTTKSLFARIGNRDGKRDNDRLSEIVKGSGGTRSLGQSVGDLISLSNPFSSLRRAAKYSQFDVDDVRQRILNEALQNGETLSDSELDKRVKKYLRDNPSGASYADTMKANREARRLKREETRRAHEEEIANMREKLSFNRDNARLLGYNLIDDDEKSLASFKDFNKTIDKTLSSKYGKEYKSMSALQKDAFKDSKVSVNAVVSTSNTVKSILGILTEGIRLKDNHSGISTVSMSDTSESDDLLETTTDSTISANNSQTKDYFTSRKINEDEKERLQQKGIFHRIGNLLEIGNKDRREHSKVWSSIFSKKGLITGGILLLLPVLMKFLNSDFAKGLSNNIQEMFGFKDDDGDRTNSVGNVQTNDDMIETGIMAATKLGYQGAHASGKAIKSVTSGAKKLGSGIKSVYNKLTKSAITNSADEAVEAAAKSSIITKFIGLLDDGIKKLTSWLTKKFPSFAKNSLGKKLISALTTILKAPGKLLGFSDDIAKGFGKIASSTATGYILDAGFVIYGGTTGATKTEAANLFGVSQDDVNGKMQTASGLLKALLSFSWFFVISLASDISVAMGGPDIVRLLAQTLYSLLVGGDADKIQELSESQTKFSFDFEKYTGVQQLLSGNAEIVTNADGSQSISIIDPSKQTESFDSYNDRVNKSIGGKIVDGAKSGWTNIKTFFTGQKGNDQAYADAQYKLDQLNSLVEQGLISKEDAAYLESKKSLEKELKLTANKDGLFTPIGTFFSNMKNSISDWWNADAVDENGNVIIDNVTGNPVKVRKINNFFTNTLTGIGKNVGYFIKGVGVSVADWWNADAVDENGNVIIDEVTGNPVKARTVNNFFTNTLTKVGGYVGTFFSNMKNSISNWWNADMVDENGNVIIDSVTGNSVKVNKINNFFTNTLSKVGGYVSGFFSGMSKAVSNWWNADAVDENGKVIIDEGTGKPVKVNKINNFFKNTIPKAIGKITGFFSGIFGGVDNWIKDMIDKGKNAGTGGPIDELNKYKVTSKYNEEDDKNIRNGKKHTGIDLTKFNNAPIESFTEGTVVQMSSDFKPNSGAVGNKDGGGYGNYVFIKDNKGYYHRYGHLNKVDVKNGQKIHKGTVLGLQGNTGNSTGSHLHYEVRKPDNKTPIDPKQYLQNYVGGPSSNINTAATQKSLVDKLLSIYGKLKYSLNGDKQNPDKGTASCASTVAWAYDKVLGFKPGGTSHASSTAQSKDKRFTTIYTNKGNNPLDLNILQPGDIIYTNWNRTSNNGTMSHTEMYGGIHNGEHSNLSHGGGAGPKWKAFNNYRKKHTMMVRRYTDFMGDDGAVINTSDDTQTPTGSTGLFGNLTGALTSELNKITSPLSGIITNINSGFNSLLGNTDPTENNVSDTNVIGNTTILKGSDEEEKIWNYLKSKGLSSYAVAGLMGNLYAESGLKSNNLENSFEKKFGLNDSQFTSKIDNNSLGKDRFLSTSSGGKYGYGLAQWTWPTRKEALYDLAKSRGVSISDIGTQLDYLWSELNGGYKDSVLNPIKNASSVKKASTIVLKKFERPADQSNSVVNKRAQFSQAYYDKYGNGDNIGGPIDDNNTTMHVNSRSMFNTMENRESTSSNLRNIIKSSKVSIDNRVYEYLIKIVDTLQSISTNTRTTANNTEVIKNKEPQQQNTAIIDNSKNQTTNSPMFDIASNRRTNKINKGYETAKLIASGAQ